MSLCEDRFGRKLLTIRIRRGEIERGLQNGRERRRPACDCYALRLFRLCTLWGNQFNCEEDVRLVLGAIVYGDREFFSFWDCTVKECLLCGKADCSERL